MIDVRAALVARAAAPLGVGLFAVAGCGGDPARQEHSAPSDYQALLDQGLDAGMNANQEAVLRLAILEGRRVTFDEYRAAKQDEMDCISELGVAIANVREVQHGGWIEVAYGFSVDADSDTDELHAAAEECRITQGQWVDLAYQYAPTQEETDALFEQFRAAMIDCLAKRGVTIEPDATREAIQAADAEQTLDPGERMCVEDTGYGAAQ